MERLLKNLYAVGVKALSFAPSFAGRAFLLRRKNRQHAHLQLGFDRGGGGGGRASRAGIHRSAISEPFSSSHAVTRLSV